MAVVWIFSRALGFCLGLGLLLAGGLGLALSYLPDAAPVVVAASLLETALFELEPFLSFEAADILQLLASPEIDLALLAGAIPPLAASILLRRRRREAAEPEGSEDNPPALKKADRRRAEKQLKELLKQGSVLEAADLCFTTDDLDRAVDLYVQAGEILRAAEIRHDQNRFREAAELYTKAGRLESAAAIYAEQDDLSKAAECFLQAGRQSLAAEMFEKVGQFARAAQCYVDAGFHRHAAQAYVRCQNWAKAAACLDEVILEEGTRAGSSGDVEKQKQIRTLVLQAGKLHEQADALDKAQAVLERGGCHSAAAEIALRRECFSEAAELFLQARDPLRAADALGRLGEDKAAAQIMGEYHRDRGEDEEAARAFEQAGDLTSAGDLYRKLQEFRRAGECFELNREPGPAAEMFHLAGDNASAARCFEAAGKAVEAAECYAELGDPAKQAELLDHAGCHLQAGEVFHTHGDDDKAIKVLQKIPAGSEELPKASAILGEIFRKKGMHSLSIKKLRQAIGDADLCRENIEAYYALATVYDSNRQLREAVDLYEKILACDYHFGDVEERLDAAREKLRIQEVSEASTTGPHTGNSLTPTGAVRYEIVGELGRGGMGIVYQAKDTVLDRVVAYKVLPDALKENPTALTNFLREAKSAAQLNHPHIVTVYDAGEQDDRYYIAMEFVDGTTLKEILRRKGAIGAGGVMHVLKQMCDALAYAHEKGIVHRDVKTANTMWTRDKQAKIMDFGLARVIEEVRNHTTLVSGTPYYMSPEQTLGRNIDHRTDLYSLGVTVFELATGQLPFREGNIPYHHVHTPPPDPSALKPDLPPALVRIISRCMEKDPEARYGSAREILAELKSARQTST